MLLKSNGEVDAILRGLAGLLSDLMMRNNQPVQVKPGIQKIKSKDSSVQGREKPAAPDAFGACECEQVQIVLVWPSRNAEEQAYRLLPPRTESNLQRCGTAA
jgi:hypothetical protein